MPGVPGIPLAPRPSAFPRAGGAFFSGLKVRKKLIILHTSFSLALLLFLIVALRPAVREVVDRAETTAAVVILRGLAQSHRVPVVSGGHDPVATTEAYIRSLTDVTLVVGSGADLTLDGSIASQASTSAFTPIPVPSSLNRTTSGAAVLFIPGTDARPGTFHVLNVRMREARAAVTRLYVFTVLTLLAGYALIALALELLVLPQQVYAPIRRLLAADEALRRGEPREELIPESDIPRDELGEIMRSRNASVIALRAQEAELADALSKLEEVANDLKRKNHLLETARRNLADADRLASLGIMSAGIAHELNTPLAVLKGLVEKMNEHPDAGVSPGTAALMLRVVHRLERLGESLLDFARVRPPESKPAILREVVEEACTLVRLDRGAGVYVENLVGERVTVECDATRMVQVLVNLVRNARDAIAGVRGADVSGARVVILAEEATRDGRTWVSIRVRDTGPGIDPAILPRLFEPFTTTRLDARGTGLGLAVAEGIVREHGGVMLARNLPGHGGAEFEIMLPTPTPTPTPSSTPSSTPLSH